MDIISEIQQKKYIERSQGKEPSIVLVHPEQIRWIERQLASTLHGFNSIQSDEKNEKRTISGLRIIRSLDLDKNEVIVK